MAKKTLPAITKLENILQNGGTITPTGAVSKCGFSNVDAVYQAVYTLRQDGLKIKKKTTPRGNAYTL